MIVKLLNKSDGSLSLLINKNDYEVIMLSCKCINLIRIIAVLLSFFPILFMNAEDGKLLVWGNDSSIEFFILDDEPITSFVDNCLKISTKSLTVTYDEGFVQKFTFEYDSTNILSYVETPLIVIQDGYNFRFDNLKKNTTLKVFNINGEFILSKTVGEEASIEISLDSYDNGLYIITSGNASYKILKE